MTPRRFACAEHGSSARRHCPAGHLCDAYLPAAGRTPARLTEHDKRERAALSFDVLSDFHAACQTGIIRTGFSTADFRLSRVIRLANVIKETYGIFQKDAGRHQKDQG